MKSEIPMSQKHPAPRFPRLPRLVSLRVDGLRRRSSRGPCRCWRMPYRPYLRSCGWDGCKQRIAQEKISVLWVKGWLESKPRSQSWYGLSPKTSQWQMVGDFWGPSKVEPYGTWNVKQDSIKAGSHWPWHPSKASFLERKTRMVWGSKPFSEPHIDPYARSLIEFKLWITRRLSKLVCDSCERSPVLGRDSPISPIGSKESLAVITDITWLIKYHWYKLYNLAATAAWFRWEGRIARIANNTNPGDFVCNPTVAETSSSSIFGDQIQHHWHHWHRCSGEICKGLTNGDLSLDGSPFWKTRFLHPRDPTNWCGTEPLPWLTTSSVCLFFLHRQTWYLVVIVEWTGVTCSLIFGWWNFHITLSCLLEPTFCWLLSCKKKTYRVPSNYFHVNLHIHWLLNHLN